MSPSNHIRLVAVLLLLIIGGSLSFAFHAAASDAKINWETTAVEPGEKSELVTRATSKATNLNEQLSHTPSEYHHPIRTAAETGSYSGDLSPEIYIVIEDIDSPFVWYNGSYYRWSIYTDRQTTNASLSMEYTEPTSVFDSISQQVSEASPDVQSVIKSGTTTATMIDSGLYRQNGTYHVVAPENRNAIGSQLVESLIGFVLTPVGRGYLAVALGLLGYQYREPTQRDILTVSRATLIAASAIPIAVGITLLFESGSLTRFVTGPVSATVVAAGVIAGVLTSHRTWLPLIGLTIGLGVLTTVIISTVLGPVGLLFGPLVAILGIITGIVPFGYGYWFAHSPSERR